MLDSILESRLERDFAELVSDRGKQKRYHSIKRPTMSDSAFFRDPFNPQDYYASLRSGKGSFLDKFKDIDDSAHFNTYMRLIDNPHTQNFVLDFGNEDAYCATDFNTNDFQTLLSRPVCRICFMKVWVY